MPYCSSYSSITRVCILLYIIMTSAHQRARTRMDEMNVNRMYSVGLMPALISHWCAGAIAIAIAIAPQS